jgi:hypothetical protein
MKLIFENFIRYCGIYLGIFLINFFRKDVKWKYLSLPTLFVICYSGILFLIYLSTPNELVWHLDTSIRRAVLPINIVLLGTLLYSFSILPENFKKEK